MPPSGKAEAGADAPLAPHAVRALALDLMDSLGERLLGTGLAARGWTFGFDRARRRLGACHVSRRRINVSAPLAAVLPAADVEDTLRHEIAHAIDAERRGRTNHDATWRALAVACGARAERCYSRPLPADDAAPYRGVCPSCGVAAAFYLEPVHPPRCRACARAGRPAFLAVTHTRGRVVWPGGAEAGVSGGRAGVVGTCPSCGVGVRRARRPSRAVACAACCAAHAGGRYDARFRLRFARPTGA